MTAPNAALVALDAAYARLMAGESLMWTARDVANIRDSLTTALAAMDAKAVAEVCEDTCGCKYLQWMPTETLPPTGTKLYTRPAVVTEAMIEAALTVMYGEQFADLSGKADAVYRDLMRDTLAAALEADR